MKSLLPKITTIHTGLFSKTTSKGDIVYLQAKHFDENGQLNSVLYPELLSDNGTMKHLLKHGDVLFAAKGSKNFATWYENKNQPAVASTSFFVIRILENYHDKILPEYLVWFINNPNTQKLLKDKAIGSSIVSISKSVLEDLEISIPDLATQKNIIKISRLRNTEKKLIKQIGNLREKQIQQTLFQFINDKL